jgi:hypothetical protein
MNHWTPAIFFFWSLHILSTEGYWNQQSRSFHHPELPNDNSKPAWDSFCSHSLPLGVTLARSKWSRKQGSRGGLQRYGPQDAAEKGLFLEELETPGEFGSASSRLIVLFFGETRNLNV